MDMISIYMPFTSCLLTRHVTLTLIPCTDDIRIKYPSAKIYTVETLYSTIYYNKYFIQLHIDKSTQYVALWTHKRHPIPRPFGRAMECLLWVLQQKLIVLYRVSTVLVSVMSKPCCMEYHSISYKNASHLVCGITSWIDKCMVFIRLYRFSCLETALKVD